MKSRRLLALGISILTFSIPAVTLAATTPLLGTASTFGIVANTYTNNVPGTTVMGDIAFTNGPTTVPAGTHTVYGSGAPFTAASTDVNTALTALNAEPCTFTFAAGAVDLATDTTHGALGIYTPGVYCVPSIATSVTIGAAGITLNGGGTYIFRFNRSLVTAPSSSVTLAGGASACDVFWTPVDNAITSSLGANSVFAGTVIGTVRLTANSNVNWTGRAFLPNGTLVTSVDDTLTVPSACTPPTPALAALHVIKHVVNNDGGTSAATAFTLRVTASGVDVAGSPAFGAEAPGTAYTLVAGTYAVSESTAAGYFSSISGDCDANGAVTLQPGDNKTCTITNDDIAVPVVVVPPVVPPTVVPPVEPPSVPPVTTVTSVVEPKTPNTGSGGDAALTFAVLLVSLMIALGGMRALRTASKAN